MYIISVLWTYSCISAKEVIIDHLKKWGSKVICCWYRCILPDLCPPPYGFRYTGVQCSISHITLWSTATKSSKLHLKFKPCCKITTMHFS